MTTEPKYQAMKLDPSVGKKAGPLGQPTTFTEAMQQLQHQFFLAAAWNEGPVTIERQHARESFTGLGRQHDYLVSGTWNGQSLVIELWIETIS